MQTLIFDSPIVELTKLILEFNDKLEPALFELSQISNLKFDRQQNDIEDYIFEIRCKLNELHGVEVEEAARHLMKMDEYKLKDLKEKATKNEVV